MDFIIRNWINNHNISELLNHCNLQEGDIIRLFRQIIDVMRQIKKANVDQNLQNKLTKAIEIINQDIIKVEF